MSLADVLRQVRERVPEIDPAACEREMASPTAPLVLDVRERDEWDQGHLPGAVHVPRGVLETRIDGVAPDKGRRVLLYCAGGSRSLLAAEALQRIGFSDVASVAGGFRRWKEEGRAVQAPEAGLGEADLRRYARHLAIPEVGEEGQRRLLASRVLLVGAGGLGSPAALYLAAAGVGTLTLVDHDVVDESNLQRQVLHDTRKLGWPKVESGRDAIRALNPGVRVEPVRERLTRDNVERLFEGQDVILDGCDNFATRYLVNDAGVKLGKPVVHGSVFRFEGQVTVLGHDGGPCYRCLFPSPPPPGVSPSCAEAGVLGILPGVVGLLEAVETIKILLGVGRTLAGRLLVYDALEASFTELRLARDPDCSVCAEGRPFPGYVEYDEWCSRG